MSYTIRPNDTLSALAARTGTTVEALAQENGIENPDLIIAGEQLKLPGASDSFEGAPGASGTPQAGGTEGAAGAANVPGPGGGDRLEWAKATAERLGLTITSTTGGTHAPGSYHYSGRAIDVAGTPEQMSQFYRAMQGSSPTELFYDPLGGIKNGAQIGAIGGHSDHVHVAF